MQSTTEPSHRPDPDPWPDAACRNHPTSTFYPDDHRDPQAAHTAKAICQTCPHLQPCRTHALQAPEPYGVWGGLSEAERHAILKRRGRGTGTPRNTVRCGTNSGYVQHGTRGEPACEACKSAHRDYRRRQRA